MRARVKHIDQSVKTAVGGPIIAAAYYALAYAVRYIGCLPAYSDVEFAGIPVAQFLLLALTGAALLLCVFAMLAGFRFYRQASASRASSERKAGRWGLLGIFLGAAAFAAIGAGALPMLDTTCP